MLTTETLDRLEALARAQIGKEIGTGIVLMPLQVLALIECARNPLFLVDTTTGTIEHIT